MAIFCSHCGTKLEDSMKFCYNCGNPPKDSPTTVTKQRPRVEYKELNLDLTKGGPPITYEPVISNNLNFPYEQTKTGIMKQVRQRSDAALAPYIADGWQLDGPFDAAVKIERELTRYGILRSNEATIVGASVRLIRYN